MYYYGGYQGYGGAPYCGYTQGGYGTGYGAAIILVLFILLVIIIGARAFDGGNNCGCRNNCNN
ncbi:MAG: sporulation protein YjcZ [Acholeplasma sp.]|nr:sporulation protein YjcZ [Acholeplasma sp.]CCY28222.1 unknown [Acholeplasma sp. CAG:878]